MGDLVTLRTEPEGVVWIEMNDPATGNALSEPMVEALLAALGGVAADPGHRVAILAGRPETFSSGADPALLERIAAGDVSPAELTLPRALFGLPVPVVAAAEGSAVGGGLALAFAADMVVLARESRYGANFVDLGFTPGMGTTRLLEHCLSPAVAHELLYSGELRRGADLAGGGVNAVAPRAEVRRTALDLALRIAAHPRESVVLLKRTLSLPRRRRFEESLTLESLMHELSFRHYDPS